MSPSATPRCRRSSPRCSRSCTTCPGRIEVIPFDVTDIPTAAEVVEDLASYADDEGEDELQPEAKARLLRLKDAAERAKARVLLN